jgi:hypothetical protein
VGIDTRIVEVVDLQSLEVEANLPATDALQARVGQQATLQIEGSAEPRAARVTRISPSTQAGSRSVLTYLGLDNPAGLRSGMFARGQLQVGDTEGIAVPLDAVRTDKPAPYVQVVQNGAVAHVPVNITQRGTLDARPTALVEGLPANAQVLRGSAGPLPAGTLVKLAPAAAAPASATPAVPAASAAR